MKTAIFAITLLFLAYLVIQALPVILALHLPSMPSILVAAALCSAVANEGGAA